MTAGIGIALLAGGPLLADDTELLLFKPHPLQNPKPNILFILDTSGSMASIESTILPYDGAQVYGGSCDSNKIYWTDLDVIPDCTTSSNFVEDAFFYCNAAERQPRCGSHAARRLARLDCLAAVPHVEVELARVAGEELGLEEGRDADRGVDRVGRELGRHRGGAAPVAMVDAGHSRNLDGRDHVAQQHQRAGPASHR